MTAHDCPQCSQTAAVAGELSDRLDALSLIVTRWYLNEGLTPPAAVGAAALTAAGSLQPSPRNQLRCLPGGAA